MKTKGSQNTIITRKTIRTEIMEKHPRRDQIEDMIDNMNKQDFIPQTVSFQKRSSLESSINHIDEIVEEKDESEFQIFVAHFKKSWYYFLLIVYKFVLSSLESFFSGIYQIILLLLRLLGYLFELFLFLLKLVL